MAPWWNGWFQVWDTEYKMILEQLMLESKEVVKTKGVVSTG